MLNLIRENFGKKFKGDGKFLFSTFSQFGVKGNAGIFINSEWKQKLKTSRECSPRATAPKTVLDALLKYIKKQKWEIILNSLLLIF